MPEKETFGGAEMPLKWFPPRDAVRRVLPAEAETSVVLPAFHLGIALIALALIGWMAPFIGSDTLACR